MHANNHSMEATKPRSARHFRDSPSIWLCSVVQLKNNTVNQCCFQGNPFSESLIRGVCGSVCVHVYFFYYWFDTENIWWCCVNFSHSSVLVLIHFNQLTSYFQWYKILIWWPSRKNHQLHLFRGRQLCLCLCYYWKFVVLLFCVQRLKSRRQFLTELPP